MDLLTDSGKMSVLLTHIHSVFENVECHELNVLSILDTLDFSNNQTDKKNRIPFKKVEQKE